MTTQAPMIVSLHQNYLLPVAQEGWALKPSEPTKEMCEAGAEALRGELPLVGELRLSLHGWAAYHAYKAMLAAAPTPASAWASEAESLPDDLEVLREGTLCLKSEYGDNSGRIDAYIVSSGEFFWGGTQTASEQRKLLVIPVSDPFASLKIAVDHIEHMANFISAMNEKHNAGYSFESLGEDMPDIRAALSATGGAK